MDREIFRWTVTLQRGDGELVEMPFRTFWSPYEEDAAEAVMRAGMATTNAKAKQAGLEQRFAPIKAEPA